MADINALGTQFTQFYYGAFDTDRTQLASLYRPQSMSTWEGKAILGGEAIITHLKDLPFAKVQHKVTTTDVQPSTADGSGNLLIVVSGLLVIDDSPNPLQFCQVFQIISEAGSYYVLNDVFRLIYGA